MVPIWIPLTGRSLHKTVTVVNQRGLRRCVSQQGSCLLDEHAGAGQGLTFRAGSGGVAYLTPSLDIIQLSRNGSHTQCKSDVDLEEENRSTRNDLAY